MSKKQKPMTFLKLNLLRALFMFVNAFIVILIYGLISNLLFMADEVSNAIFPILFSVFIWGDIFVFLKFKGDLFSEKYSNTNSQWIFQVMLVIDFIAAPVLVILGVVKIIQYLI